MVARDIQLLLLFVHAHTHTRVLSIVISFQSEGLGFRVHCTPRVAAKKKESYCSSAQYALCLYDQTVYESMILYNMSMCMRMILYMCM